MWFKRRKQMYLSELDAFLQAFDRKPEATSANRRREEATSARIAQLRDQKQSDPTGAQLWADF